MNTKFPFVGGLLACLFLGGNAHANDDALYQKALPPDAIFVRVLEVSAESNLRLFDFDFSTIADDHGYVAISRSLLKQAPASLYTTLFYNAAGIPLVFEEPDRVSTSKVHLILLNAGDAPAKLVANGGAVDVIDSLAPGESGLRAVNPISTSLAVVSGEDILAEFDVSMRRGEDLTFVVSNGSVDLIPTTFGVVVTD